ncbi:25e54b59-bf0b-4358-98e0-eda45898698b [Sclerotinia trifoliorum]|uniref:25e54b59-bf0b-4358-98e0-eda45898698b n=1 Tax=Sclerotinia trifoliorum TaxID=28548 RepID=A0A8H2VP40_9HELO|nr:25e54b59-bf0b-4358-98e0-eda45898698b [Sclerotinia trifoliorum]
MNNRNGPLSPVSIGSNNEWSGIEKYQDDNDSPYQMNRGQLASPPISSDSNGTMNGGDFPPRGTSGGGSPGNPSPPSSVGRSSIGTGLYAGSENGQDKKDEQFEAILSEHYVSLRRYLAASLRDEKGNPRPNRARDKLLRLSPVQFQELSTDVFDELLRRQQAGSRTPNGQRNDQAPPPYLLPKNTFHPKRNQARQKLSTLPPPRFRDLATDVFYELERRFPQFTAGDRSRMGSPVSTRGPPSRNGNGAPMDLPPRGPSRMRRPSDASSIGPYSMRSESRNGSRMPPPNGPNGSLGVPPSPGMPPNDYGRPTPKTFQSNTIVPNKSTMVEDDDSGPEDNDDDDGDAFGLEGAARNRESKKSTRSLDTDKKLIEDYQSQIAELRERLDSMEDDLKRKDDELNIVMDQQRGKDVAVDTDKKEWDEVRMDLENKLADAQSLNDTLQSELDRVRESQASLDRELKSQIEELQIALVDAGKGGGSGDADLERENEELKAELREQQEITEDVRSEAQEFLREMRALSERSTASYNREEQLEIMVNKLEDEVKEWRNRYAKTKTQLRSLKTSSIGLSIQDAAKYAKDNGFTAEDGLVKDVHVTKFQLSIDELLQTARSSDPERVIGSMKIVVMTVRQISQDIDEAPPNNEELAQKQARLKSRLSATANNLITASKNFVGAKGLSPVSLLDAAASHLTTAVVELVRTVKIKPTPAGELEDNDDGNLAPLQATVPAPVTAQPSTVGGFFGSKPATTEPKPGKAGGIFGFFTSREAKQGNGPPQQEAAQPQKENVPPQQGNTRQSMDASRQSLTADERQSEDSQRQSLNGYVPGPFLGLRNGRASTGSSMYSPINSPRESIVLPQTSGMVSLNAAQPNSAETPLSPMTNGADPVNGNAKPMPLALQPPPGPPSHPPSPIPAPMGIGFGIRSQDSDIEDLKIYLEDQTALLVQNIQSLVSSIRSEGGINAISTQIDAIASVVGEVVASTEEAMINNPALRSQSQPVLAKLSECRKRIMAAGEEGREIANEVREDEGGDAEWRAWNQSLPPIAFEIARETKELVLRVDVLDGEGGGDDDFS